jgi:hypothetical protein
MDNLHPRFIPDRDLIAELRQRGYIVRHKTETKPLMWSRTLPFPDGVDFKAEALEKLREQITPEMIHIETRLPPVMAGVGASEIQSAILRVL